ncbi:hypothetical protein Xcel_1376 [Xylanimonas cellulosilytica DSM 15894]|uniref:GmrSD restriction endonucleases C-terminal domain-containing protein n=1 Tax=Xylanimonas cellulosilytica (strain DSM 15894 / JCM 12276 / CECT 5975 / KCTC 9989 / LMG 20990 / NBRC 107835 / XIL07) TaxID=446471 RepID=D1BRF2_XYLCX|nr:hypothetical protein Xcel_1376 [Xylanimonas cellulosilytica DSM 15894]
MPSPAVDPPTAPNAPAPGSALEAALVLPVRNEDPWNDYDRGLFGDAWTDVDHNGCDQRNDILARDLVDVVFRAGTNGCVVHSGTLADPYSGQTFGFLRGPDTSVLVQIDHVVAIANAWRTGAQHWTTEQRVAFANDPLNLLAVDGELNQAKSAGDASEWLPPNPAFHCEYAARQTAVKTRHGLWFSTPERDVVVGILEGCPGQRLPVG